MPQGIHSLRAVALALFVVVSPVAAAADTLSPAQVDTRVGEIDAALAQLQADVLAGRITDAQLFVELQKSLAAEKTLLVERKALLQRLQAPGTAASAPATAAPAPAAAAAPAGPLTLMPIARVKPNIPDAVCRQRASGWVDLEFAVMPDGSVLGARVTGSQPAGAFDSAALEAVSARRYPPQAEPVKLRERLPMSFADCRSEQLRALPPMAEGGTPPPQEDCPVLAAEARSNADPIAREESGRAVLGGIEAQAYSAPTAHCFVAGRKLRAGLRLVAHSEYKGYSLVSAPKGGDFFWVRSNQLKDVTP